MKTKIHFNNEMNAEFAQMYQVMSGPKVAAHYGMNVYSVWKKARMMGLSKRPSMYKKKLINEQLMRPGTHQINAYTIRHVMS